jgi:peptidoglycan hydrolase-like protein with peptidoglycan-binding domain
MRGTRSGDLVNGAGGSHVVAVSAAPAGLTIEEETMATTRLTKLAARSAMAAAAAAGLALVPGTAALAAPHVALIGPGPRFHNDPDAVECVQAGVGEPLDGQYGQATYDAVRWLQQIASLPADGIVGPQTGDLILQGMSAAWTEQCYPLVPTTWQTA